MSGISTVVPVLESSKCNLHNQPYDKVPVDNFTEKNHKSSQNDCNCLNGCAIKNFVAILL